MAETILNLRGLKCPLPALKARKALTKLAAGDTLVLECTDPLSTIDIPNLVRETGDVLEANAQESTSKAMRGGAGGNEGSSIDEHKASRNARNASGFEDDGFIPNNPTLAFVVFRRAIEVDGSADPEATIEQIFQNHGWGGLWRNGVFPLVHYHSRIHEALGIARGRAKVRFGGEKGVEVDLHAGDVAVLACGTGQLMLVGKPRPRRHRRLPLHRSIRSLPRQPGRTCGIAPSIPAVPLPATDPVHGEDGPLIALWKTKMRAAPKRSAQPDAT